MRKMHHGINRRPLISAGTLLGIGLGGLVDGIVLHQLLQLHNMMSAKYPVRGVDVQTLAIHLEVNMFWDGLFHAFCWIMTMGGLGLLWYAVRRPDAVLSTATLAGSMLLGWGLFNLVEGLINHHVLHLHHVVEGANHLMWDLAFLASGVLLIAVGGGLIYSARPGRGPQHAWRPGDQLARSAQVGQGAPPGPSDPL